MNMAASPGNFCCCLFANPTVSPWKQLTLKTCLIKKASFFALKFSREVFKLKPTKYELDSMKWYYSKSAFLYLLSWKIVHRPWHSSLQHWNAWRLTHSPLKVSNIRYSNTGCSEKPVFFTIHCNSSLAYIAL